MISFNPNWDCWFGEMISSGYKWVIPLLTHSCHFDRVSSLKVRTNIWKLFTPHIKIVSIIDQMELIDMHTWCVWHLKVNQCNVSLWLPFTFAQNMKYDLVWCTIPIVINNLPIICSSDWDGLCSACWDIKFFWPAINFYYMWCSTTSNSLIVTYFSPFIRYVA